MTLPLLASSPLLLRTSVTQIKGALFPFDLSLATEIYNDPFSNEVILSNAGASTSTQISAGHNSTHKH